MKKRLKVPIKKNRNNFNDEDLTLHKKLITKESDPELWDDSEREKLYGMKIVSDARLIDLDEINRSQTDTQTVRVGGKNPDKANIKHNIRAFGYDLSAVPPIIVMKNLTSGELEIVDGRTRIEILKELNAKNVLVTEVQFSDEYLNLDGSRKTKCSHILRRFGLRGNNKHKPAGKGSMDDMIRAIRLGVEEGTVKNNLNDILKEVNICSAEGQFNNQKRNQIAQRIYTETTSHDLVKPFATKHDSESFENELNNDKNSYKNGGRDRWIVYAGSTCMLSIMRALKQADKYPDDVIKFVLHCGTLRGGDLEENWFALVDKYRKTCEELMEMLARRYNRGPKSKIKPIILAGFAPQLGSLHDNMNEPILCVPRTKKNPSGLSPDNICDEKLKEWNKKCTS